MTLFDPPATSWSVGSLLGTVDALVEQVFPGDVWVEGEMRNISRSRANHVYFDLVDAERPDAPSRPSLPVVLFDSDRQNVNRTLTSTSGSVRMTDGTLVRIRGRVRVYEAKGTIQLTMSAIDPSFTLGLLGLDRERILAALREEGLLEANSALPLDLLPLDVALVTSRGSAAFADVVHELESSGYRFNVRVIDCPTQGPDVPNGVARALRRAEAFGVDVALLVRGGGSRTDLAGFDHEVVARTIAGLSVPVWTGIGHETDRSVADELAHTAHKTPTACGAALVERVRTAERRLEGLWDRATTAADTATDRVGERLLRLGHRCSIASMRRVDRERLHVLHLSDRLVRAAPRSGTTAARTIDDLERRTRSAAGSVLDRRDQQLTGLSARARVHDLTVALSRGWTITRRPDGTLVRSPDDVDPGDPLVTLTAGGELRSIVEGRGTS